jgi:dinuclear metal center YbgI/SA1388 family protein
MPHCSLAVLVRHANRLLQVEEFQDWEGAVNGLQVENRGRVHRIAAAVDATRSTIRKAAAAGADLLLVHHGLFWSETRPWTGPRYEMIRMLVEHDLAVYSAHLPLDAHPKLGNNAQLCAAIGLKRLKPFFPAKGRLIGLRGEFGGRREELCRKLQRATGADVKLLPGGPPICRQVGVVTGGGGEDLLLAAAAGVDTFVTGEGPHWTYAIAEDAGINVLYGGHYATETFGVRSLAAHLAKRFRLSWLFVSHPTGL